MFRKLLEMLALFLLSGAICDSDIYSMIVFNIFYNQTLYPRLTLEFQSISSIFQFRVKELIGFILLQISCFSNMLLQFIHFKIYHYNSSFT